MTESLNGTVEEDNATDTSALFLRLKGWFGEDIVGVKEWRKEARESLNFYAGDQWSEEDKSTLQAKRRPIMTHNRIAPLVNAVVGSEINNRREVRYIPREEGDAKANEVLTAAAEWFRDECGAEDEEGDAFKSAVIGGMGWTDTRLDFTDEPDGAPVIERIDSFEMVWDNSSVKPNLTDARRMFRVREMSWDEAEDLTGIDDRARLYAGWARNAGSDSSPHNQERANAYDGGQDQFTAGKGPKRCVLVEARWLEKETYYRGPDPENPGEEREYTEELVLRLSRAMEEFTGSPFPAVKQTRKVVRRAFLGSEVLGEPDKPMVPTGLFGWECITGYRDESKGLWYGIVRVAKDPQRWANKFFSQVMFLLNSQAKGGIMAEKRAFDDIRDFEQKWAQSDAISLVADGALTGQNPAIIPKPVAQFPQGFFALFQESKEAISQVTGLSQEFIGTRNVDQANVLETQRRQSSLNLLAELFNSLRRYRKRQGRVMLFLIQEHLADGRLVRIVGDGLKQYVPLTKENIADVEYDIIVDDSPTSPNEKERTWAILQQMLPLVRDMVTPDVMLELLRYSPLPTSLVEKLQQQAMQAAQQPPEPSPQQIEAQAKNQKQQLDIAAKTADVQHKQASAQVDLQAKQQQAVLDWQKGQQSLALADQKNEIEAQSLSIKEQQNELAQQRVNSQRISAILG